VDDLALVVHDFGGPIGLSYAIDNPDRIRALVLFNTWMWSVADDRAARLVSRLAASPVGRFLYRRLDVATRLLLKMVVADRSKLPKHVHRHYIAPFRDDRERTGPWTLAKELRAGGRCRGARGRLADRVTVHILAGIDRR
jgi:haloalkane dehalogenase